MVVVVFSYATAFQHQRERQRSAQTQHSLIAITTCTSRTRTIWLQVYKVKDNHVTYHRQEARALIQQSRKDFEHLDDGKGMINDVAVTSVAVQSASKSSEACK